MLKNKSQLLSVLFVIASLLIFKNYWYQEGVNLGFYYDQTEDVEYQIFYTSDPNEVFEEFRSVRKRIDKGAGYAKIFLQTNNVEKLRIDIGYLPGITKISQIRFRQENPISLDLRNFIPANIDSFASTENNLHMEVTHSDPFIVYSEPLQIKASEVSVNWFALFLCVTLPFYVVNTIKLLLTLQVDRETAKLPSLMNVEFLRIIFTLLVLIQHFFVFFDIFCMGGQAAVQFFFLLSGYLLAMTFNPNRSLLGIAINRWIRFVPLAVLGGVLIGAEWESFSICFLLQCTGLTVGEIPNEPAWYISILFWCTMLYLLIMRAFEKKVAISIISVIGFMSLLIVVHTDGDRHELFAGFLSRGLLRGISGMAIGIVLAQLCRRTQNDNSQVSKKLLYTIAESGILVYVLWGCFDVNVYPESWTFQVISLVALLYLFVLRRGYVTAFFEKRVFVTIAKYCLSIYLTHVFFIRTVHLYVAMNYPGWQQAHACESIIIAIIGSCLVGIAAHHLVEKPCVYFLKRFISWLKD